MKTILSLIAMATIALAVFVFLIWDPPKKEAIYYVGWTSKLTGFEGQGTKAFPKAVALKWIETGNHKHPDIEHYLVESDILTVRR